MKGMRTLGASIVLASFLALAGSAAADRDLFLALDDDLFEDELFGFGGFGRLGRAGAFDVDSFAILDVDEDLFARSSFDRELDLDRDNVLFGLALDDDLDVFDVADFRTGGMFRSGFSRDIDLDRSDVFGALILGI